MATKRIQIGDTNISFDEQKNEIQIRTNWQPSGPSIYLVTTFDGARELLDCLLVEFGRTDLTQRYPEVR